MKISEEKLNHLAEAIADAMPEYFDLLDEIETSKEECSDKSLHKIKKRALDHCLKESIHKYLVDKETTKGLSLSIIKEKAAAIKVKIAAKQPKEKRSLVFRGQKEQRFQEEARRSYEKQLTELHKDEVQGLPNRVLANKDKKKNIIMRYSIIIVPQMVGQTVAVFNGIRFVRVSVTEDMVGKRLGDIVKRFFRKNKRKREDRLKTTQAKHHHHRQRY